ncbi:MAG TPA: aminotransferase class III-fold pyridoxal phosphate-dependent enzyme, partial [Methylomirabilota bacterium]|nr:aminotransferase class III-fold pyridoxal phosphate-dependent enzyme [Methylomirabilota bacterium]
QGEGGVYPVSEEFWNLARQLTRFNRTLLIADEIQCGLGRTGRYFAYQKFASKPDIVVVAKPLAAGLPLGAILTTQAVADAVSPGLHGTTFGGGPLICATALEVLNIIDEKNLLENVRARGAQLRAGLERLADKFPIIREIRGEGLMLGIELTVDGAPFVEAALRRGLLINCTHERTLRLLPPFIVTPAQIDEFLRLFETVLAKSPRKALEPASTVPPKQAGRALAAAR